jgi:hypothetical protein
MATNTDEIKKVKKQVKELTELVASLTKIIEEKDKEIEVRNKDTDRDVLFISLCIGTLNLSTARNGGGDIYTFHEFGEEQMIPYSDAKNIIKNNKSFIKGGKVFIDDEDLIKNERLTKDYENILSYKKLLDLFNVDAQTFEKIFSSIPKGQKESFKDILSQKIIKGEKVDRNLIYIVNQEMNTNIEEKIENGKNLME